MKILIYIQSAENKINPISLEALAAAQELKKQRDAEIYVVTFSDKISNDLAQYDINEIIYVDNDNLKEYSPLHFLEAFNQLNNKYNPDYLIFGHTYETRDWVPRLSARLDIPFLSDCIGMKIEDNLLFTRSLYQNKINADLMSKAAQSIISFQSGAYRIDALEMGSSSISKISMDLSSVSNQH